MTGETPDAFAQRAAETGKFTKDSIDDVTRAYVTVRYGDGGKSQMDQLEAAIKAGIFREDLFYRLNVISFEMPALIQRKEDIPLLAEHFLYRFAQETNKPTDKHGSSPIHN